MKYVLGFDIGGTKSAVLLARPGEEQVEFLERKAIPTCGAWREMLDCLAEMGEAFLEEHRVSREECCAGISCGGPLDSKKGLILSPPNLPGWDQVPAASYLEQRLGMDVRLRNDADACALAEWRYGAGKGWNRTGGRIYFKRKAIRRSLRHGRGGRTCAAGRGRSCGIRQGGKL